MSSRTPTATQRLATPDRILQAAIKLFAQNGFRGTTTRQIAQTAQVNEALIFRHFPTKERLYSAIIEHKMQDRFRVDLLDAASAPVNDQEFFRGVGNSLLDSISGDPAMIRLLYFSALEGHELCELFYQSYTRRFIGLLTSRIQEGIDGGRFRKVDAGLAARALLGMFVHMGMARELFAQSDALPAQRRIVEAFAGIFLRGIEA